MSQETQSHENIYLLRKHWAGHKHNTSKYPFWPKASDRDDINRPYNLLRDELRRKLVSKRLWRRLVSVLTRAKLSGGDGGARHLHINISDYTNSFASGQ